MAGTLRSYSSGALHARQPGCCLPRQSVSTRPAAQACDPSSPYRSPARLRCACLPWLCSDLGKVLALTWQHDAEFQVRPCLLCATSRRSPGSCDVPVARARLHAFAPAA